MAYVAVLGAANVDIGGFFTGRAVAGDSNPGRVRLTMGGVGRNIACNAARMGLNVEMITALGGDAYADMICADCARAGVSLKHARRFGDASSSAYLYIADESGDMTIAINDMGIHDRMTVDRLEPLLDVFSGASLVVLEANPPAETLRWLAENLTVPLVADAVSAAKVEKLRPILPRLDTFKPNRIEAKLLTGVDVTDAQSAGEAVRRMLDAGVRRVFLTLGTDGVCCGEGDEILFLPCVPVKMTNATGAGDAFTAALAWARMKGLSLRESALAGMASSSIAVQSVSAVSEEMSEEALLKRMSEIKEKTGGCFE